MRTKRGFTLIELLVVISIIALLLSILMPSLSKVKAKAREVMGRSNLKQWGLYINLYLQDNNGRFFNGYSTGDGDGTWIGSRSLMPYYEDGGEKVRICPETTKTYDEGEHNPAKMIWDTTIKGEYHKNSYSINNWVYNVRAGRKSPFGGFPDFLKYNWGKLGYNQSNLIPIFLEGWRWGGGPVSRSDDAPPDPDTIYNRNGFDRFCINRHNGSVNICFMDSSVRKVRLKELWDLKWHRGYDLHVQLPTWPDWLDKLD